MKGTLRRLIYLGLLMLIGCACVFLQTLQLPEVEGDQGPVPPVERESVTLAVEDIEGTSVASTATRFAVYQQTDALLTEVAAATETALAPEGGGQNQDLPDFLLKDYYYWVIYEGCPWGDPGRIKLTLVNQGNAAAAAVAVTANGVTVVVDGIVPGEEKEIAIPFESGPLGMIQAEVDPENLIAELDEENNTWFILFTPPPTCTPEKSSP